MKQHCPCSFNNSTNLPFSNPILMMGINTAVLSCLMLDITRRAPSGRIENPIVSFVFVNGDIGKSCFPFKGSFCGDSLNGTSREVTCQVKEATGVVTK
jgi:hypothetical protein